MTRSEGLHRVHRGEIPFSVTIEYNSALHHSHARHRSFCRRRTEAIGAHHGVLDISTIDTSSCQVRAAFFPSQVTEGFADEQSFAALTEHTPLLPFYLSLIISVHLGAVPVDDALLGHATGCLLDPHRCSPFDLILVEKTCEWVTACSLQQSLACMNVCSIPSAHT